MITVIADDITGAAEIAGVCIRYGLSVTLDFDLKQLPNTDVWIIATDTRSYTNQKAIKYTEWLGGILKDHNITNIFKKIDSVLRGHIIDETKALLKFIPKKRVLILPANPEMNRIIRNGIYYVRGKMLSETSFARDPDFPARFSSVDKILATNHNDSSLFVTPDILTDKDYKTYAEQITDDILPVGGSVFFEVFLTTCHAQLCKPAKTISRRIKQNSNVLMICGSTHDNSIRFVDRLKDRFSVFEIPLKLIEEGETSPFMPEWVSNIVDAISANKRVIITTNRSEIKPEHSGTIKSLITEATKQIMNQIHINELYVEGGATTYSIIKKLGFSSFVPITEYARGVVCMNVYSKEKFSFSIKPGSYEWPDSLFSRLNPL